MQKMRPGLLALALIALFVPRGCAQSRNQKREARYQSALQTYSELIKIGATRKEVEETLRSKNTPFGQICCVEPGTTFSDLITIGEEKHPWYCSSHTVYVAILFVARDPNAQKTIKENDTVQKLRIWHHLDGCL
jgi:hypothetical protein